MLIPHCVLEFHWDTDVQTLQMDSDLEHHAACLRGAATARNRTLIEMGGEKGTRATVANRN